MNRLKQHFDGVTRLDIIFKDHLINVMQIPVIRQITLNTGIGKKAVVDRKQMIAALLALELITGQKPIITRAKKSIDKFKLREKMPIGCKVTLRRGSALRILERLIIGPVGLRPMPSLGSSLASQGSLKPKGPRFVLAAPRRGAISSDSVRRPVSMRPRAPKKGS